MAAYMKVAHAADLPPGQAMAVTVGDKRIALFSVDGAVVAIDDTCTHRGGPLSEGELQDGIVTCPWMELSSMSRTARSSSPRRPIAYRLIR